jgi:hypothetical protein
MVKAALSLAALGVVGQAGVAAPLPLAYRGLIELDHGSSIVGIPRHSRYWVDFVLDGSVVDDSHVVFENGFVNAYGVRGLSTMGLYPPPFLFIQFTADSSNGITLLDLSGLTFAYTDTGGSGADVRDANLPPDPQLPPCVDVPCISEHINLSIRPSTPGAPLEVVWFNLYNSNFYDPIYATRQLLLDTSTPDNGFRLIDLFLKGPETLAEFKSYRTPDFKALVDGVMFDGPSGTLASGRFLSLQFVPGPLPVLGCGAAFGWSRRLRRRIRRAEATPAPAPPSRDRLVQAAREAVGQRAANGGFAAS